MQQITFPGTASMKMLQPYFDCIFPVPGVTSHKCLLFLQNMMWMAIMTEPRYPVSLQMSFGHERVFALDMLHSLQKCAGNWYCTWRNIPRKALSIQQIHHSSHLFPTFVSFFFAILIFFWHSQLFPGFDCESWRKFCMLKQTKHNIASKWSKLWAKEVNYYSAN